MGSAEKPPLIELEVIRDTFVTGVASVHIMGHNARITIYVDQEASGDTPAARIVVSKMVVALDSIPAGMREVVKATWGLISDTLFMDIAEADRTGRH